ncbi:hypothetical protein GA0070610_1762 [Micromonospora echinofusca]|uniref:Head-to-tail adaptor n=1 Tax=Micromonospora echinofusca TaxID=47858 RepID=A0A1C5G759_MICEH|nr:hypothetical protein [Micromonospora echinofusca]SCG15528.1 hypothetical protein GA0070610_1762 [Micromonospora echinofusca]
MTQPVRTGPCSWPLNTAYLKGWTELDEAVRTTATDLATEVLWALSGRRFGLCSSTVRPCRRDDRDQWWREGWLPLPYAGALPYGSLLISLCGCADWSCGCLPPGTEVSLPGPVHAVTQVLIDGQVLPAAAYVVHNRRWLVRVDGEKWPASQDLRAADDQPGAWAVTYQRGVEVPAGGRIAAGQYAAEVAKVLTADNSCRLPRRVQSLVRQGVQQTFVDPAQLAKDGMTGLPEVDQWLRVVNPHRLPRDTVVWSPDLNRGRRRTS